MSEKLYFSKIPKVECLDLEPYYLVFKEGVPHAAEAFALEFKNNQVKIERLERERDVYWAALKEIEAKPIAREYLEQPSLIARKALAHGEKIRNNKEGE